MIFSNFNKIHNKMFIEKVETERLKFKTDISKISTYEALIDKKEKHLSTYNSLKEDVINLNIQFLFLFLIKTFFLLVLTYLNHHFSTEKDMLFFIDFSLLFIWSWDLKDLCNDVKENWQSFSKIRTFFYKRDKKNLLNTLSSMRIQDSEKDKLLNYYNENDVFEWDYNFFQYKLLIN